MKTGSELTMRFSVVVPVYKAERYIDECINSVLNQSFRDFELILVDDGSPDKCPSICDKYVSNDGRVRVIHQENRGAVAARKTGLKAAVGEYVIIADSDDYIDHSLLERLNGIIENYNPDIVKYNLKRFSEKSYFEQANKFKNVYFDRKNIDTVLNCLMYDKDVVGINFGSIIFSLWSGAVRRDLILKYLMPVPVTIRMGDDLAVTAPMLFDCNSIYFADFVGYYYRDTEGSIVNSFNPEEIKLLNIVVSYLCEKTPDEYMNSVSVYALNMVLRYFSKAAKLYGKKEFKEWIANGLSDYIYNIASNSVVYKKGIKDFIKIILFRKKRYGTLWYLFRLGDK